MLFVYYSLFSHEFQCIKINLAYLLCIFKNFMRIAVKTNKVFKFYHNFVKIWTSTMFIKIKYCWFYLFLYCKKTYKGTVVHFKADGY